MQTEVDATKTDNGLIFTESAAKKVKTLIEDEKNPNLKLGIYHRWRLFRFSVWIHF